MVGGGIVVFIVFKWARMTFQTPKEEPKKGSGTGPTITRKKIK
jgi:hypothetical protein